MGKLLTTTLILSSIFINNSFAQYYYKDILSTKQSAADMLVLKAHQVKSVEVHSFEADDEPSKGFYCEKKISNNYHKLETYSRSFVSSKSLLTTSFNDKGLLIKSIDSSGINSSTSEYSYDDSGRVILITSYSRSSDDDFATAATEVHQYQYNNKWQLQKMLRIKNQKDTTEIDFVVDDKGNVTEEIEVAVYSNHYYYYYDRESRLTDIVRYNIVKGKALPDYTFEYDDDGLVVQMIATDEGVNANYFVWKYLYDEGLRIKEKCYSKERQLLGYFEYEYK